MPAALYDLIRDGWDSSQDAHGYLKSSMNHLSDFADNIQANQWTDAHNNIELFGWRISQFGSELMEDWWPAFSFAEKWYDALKWINTNWPTTSAVTMDDIINAMLTADPSQVDYFIGLVDAYRVAIWDKPFNEEFYMALAEGFKQWE